MSTSIPSPISAPTSTPTSTQPQALIPFLYPYILTFLRKFFSLALAFHKYAINFLGSLSHSVVLSPLAYILAPLFTFATILISITLVTPWKFLTWLIEALFPLYVFCGVACITGALVGFGGRVICLGIVRTIGQEQKQEERGLYDEETSKTLDLDPDTRRSPKRRKVEREVKFKSEDSDA